MKGQRFEIVPPGKLARVMPIVLAGLPPAIILATMAIAARGRHEAVPYLPVSAALLLFPLIGGLLAWSMLTRTIKVEAGRLDFGVLPWRRIPVAALDLDAARIVDLDAQPGLQPVFKIAGSGLPGYKSGMFRLRNAKRAQLLLTDWKRVLVLPRRDGGIILLSPQRPDALLAALQELAAGDRPRGRG
jgi:hypothetical protein